MQHFPRRDGGGIGMSKTSPLASHFARNSSHLLFAAPVFDEVKSGKNQCEDGEPIAPAFPLSRSLLPFVHPPTLHGVFKLASFFG